MEEVFRLKRERRQQVPRTLRIYCHVANQNHGICLQCQTEIKPGDEYEGFVVVVKRTLRVQKYHLRCPEDFYEEERDAKESSLVRDNVRVA